tara:strand:+ start:150 stop:758 length:609 start_codon:yes stop_codon:yes gene_type:complete
MSNSGFDKFARKWRLPGAANPIFADAEKNKTEQLQAIKHEAQQSFRFYLNINGVHAACISDVQRPSYRVETEEKRLLNWGFKFPTRVTWNPISFTVQEVFSREIVSSISNLFMQKFKEGYDLPNQINTNNPGDLSKSKLMESFGKMTIQMLNPEGEKCEEWELFQAFITEVAPSGLDYKSEDLTNLRITVSYDWADLQYYKR